MIMVQPRRNRSTSGTVVARPYLRMARNTGLSLMRTASAQCRYLTTLPDGGVLGYEDVFTKINLCRAHYEKVGLGRD